jgi:hypothetical protein
LTGRIVWTVFVAAVFAGAASAFGYKLQGLLNPNRPLEEMAPFFVIAPAGAVFVATAAVWWWGMMRYRGAGVLRGVSMGALSVVASYIVFAVGVSLLLFGIQTLPWLLLLAPVATGWLTLPLGAALGALLGLAQRWLWKPVTESDLLVAAIEG